MLYPRTVSNKTLELLKQNYNYELDFIAKNTLKGEIEGIKVDCITHDYPWIESIHLSNQIRMANLIDIAAMKLNAITTNGTRIKDFIDLVYFSKHLTLNQMLQGYEKKYRNNIIMALKSLFYYDEVNLSEPIQMIEGNFKWEAITQRLIDMQNNPDKLFSNPIN